MTALTNEATASSRGYGRSILGNWRALLALRPSEASFAKRGFFSRDDETRHHFERIGETFIAGFNCALVKNLDAVKALMNGVGGEHRGFAVEGAAMGFALADALSLQDRKLRRWLACTEEEFTYLTHVGAGWAMARVPWRKSKILAALDPVHCWLACDGLGFHDGYFWSTAIRSGWRRIGRGYAARAYDQGVGRAIWFICAGDFDRALEAISRFDSVRQSDLWSGLGLAATYAGPISLEALVRVAETAGRARWSLAQGAAFAAEARGRAHHIPAHTVDAVRALAACDFETAVQVVRQARTALSSAETPEAPRYEQWRSAVRNALRFDESGLPCAGVHPLGARSSGVERMICN